MRTFGASSSSANADPSRRAADYRAGVLSTRFPSAVHSGSDIALPAPGLRALPSPPSQPLEPPARECLLYIPSELPVDRPVPFLVMLHGAGGDPEPMVTLVQPQADRHGVVVLAPPSLGRSWDTISGRSYGPDVKALDFWLDHVLHHLHVPINPQQAAIGGFSDGASYALSLGLINGDLWSHVLAFSPGFMRVTREVGPPSVRVFVSHGKADPVLPIHRCSRQLVPKIQGARYPLDYVEFEGGHTVPEPIVDRAFAWLLRREEGGGRRGEGCRLGV